VGKKSAPSPGTVIMPAPAAPPPSPQVYRSFVPLESYQMAGDYLKRIEEETAKIQEQRYQEVGTPGELGARARSRDLISAAAYEASLPTADKYLAQTTGKSDQFEPVKQAAKQQVTQAQVEYAKALLGAIQKPKPTVAETPSWAQKTV